LFVFSAVNIWNDFELLSKSFDIVVGGRKQAADVGVTDLLILKFLGIRGRASCLSFTIVPGMFEVSFFLN
jgi:hypothetical protein